MKSRPPPPPALPSSISARLLSGGFGLGAGVVKGKRGNPPECCGSSCGHLLAEAPDSPSRPRALHIIPSPQSTGSLQKPQPLGLNFLLLLQLLGCCFLLITRFSEQGPEGELCFCKLSCISSNKAFCLAPSLSSAPPPPPPPPPPPARPHPLEGHSGGCTCGTFVWFCSLLLSCGPHPLLQKESGG